MSTSNGKANRKDSTSSLLRLFNSGRSDDHRVVTRLDLTTNYPGNDDSLRTSNSDNVVAINNYYTWNSSRTNSSIHKERAEIISALHSVKSASELHRGLTTCNGFTRSPRLREIMSMCADRRGDFSMDDYHHHDHGNDPVAVETESDDVASAWSVSGATAARSNNWSSSYIGGSSRCWSCTATDRETDDDDDDDDDGNENNATVDEAHFRRTSNNRRMSWIRKLNHKFRKSHDSR